MSIRFPDDEGRDVVVYTDGFSFCNLKNHLLHNVGLELDTSFVSANQNTLNFSLREGIWKIPFEYRLCVYNAAEILNNPFLDIKNRVTIYPSNFLYLEKEMEINLSLSKSYTEQYYDITIYNEKEVVNLLKEDMSLAEKGNLYYWKDKLHLIDYIFNK